MQGLDFGLKDRNQSGLDFGMDESYTDFLSKARARNSRIRNVRKKAIKKAIARAEKKGNDKRVISLSNKLEQISSTPRGRFVKGQKPVPKKNCQERLKTMRLTQDGMERFIKTCEEAGDYSASKVVKKEEVAEALLRNEIVKNERVEDRVEDEINSTLKEQAERKEDEKKPFYEKKDFIGKILPILAIGGIVYLTIKKF